MKIHPQFIVTPRPYQNVGDDARSQRFDERVLMSTQPELGDTIDVLGKTWVVTSWKRKLGRPGEYEIGARSWPSVEPVKRPIQVYVASKLSNIENVRTVRRAIVAAGHQVTYSWGEHAEDFKPGIAEMRKLAKNEIDACVKADVVLAMLPGGRGTHGELGAALAAGKKVVMNTTDPALLESWNKLSVFYEHELVVHKWQCQLAQTLAKRFVQYLDHLSAERDKELLKLGVNPRSQAFNHFIDSILMEQVMADHVRFIASLGKA